MEYAALLTRLRLDIRTEKNITQPWLELMLKLVFQIYAFLKVIAHGDWWCEVCYNHMAAYQNNQQRYDLLRWDMDVLVKGTVYLPLHLVDMMLHKDRKACTDCTVNIRKVVVV